MNKKKAVLVVVSLVLIVSIVAVAVYFVLQSLAPKVVLTYHGENVVPEGIVNFPSITDKPFFYSWNLTMTNLNPVSGIGVPAESALQPLVSKYPQLVTMKMTNSDELTLLCDVTAFTGNMAEQCFVLFTNSQLSSDQITSLTEDLNTQLAPALIEWYS